MEEEEEQEFFEKRAGEKIIVSAGKHWFFLLLPAAKVFLGLVLVFIVLRFLGASIYFTIAFFVWAALGLTYFIITYIIWAKSRYYVTDQRVIRQEQKSLFAKEVTEVDLANIHTVTYEITGAASAAFNFGDVVLQSYGAPKPIILKNVSRAKDIQKKVSQMVSEIASEEQKDKESEKPAKKIKHPKKYIPRAPRIEESE